MATKQARICNLFLKPNRRAPMVVPATGRLRLIAGLGIEGDKNAHPFSPRQVLITRLEDLASLGVAPGALRENIVVEHLAPELFVPGAVLQVDAAVSIRLTFHCEPCKRIADVVRSLREVMGKRGILGIVLSGGVIRIGDAVRVDRGVFEPMSPRPYDRFLCFIAQIPSGKVVTYRHITIGMGVAENYLRAIPGYISRAAVTSYPLHRIVDSNGDLIPSHVPDQRSRLAAEGVDVVEEQGPGCGHRHERVDLDRFGWFHTSLFV